MLVMAPNTSRHLDAEEIERYSMGVIPDEECTRFEEHLLLCEICRDRVSESDRVVAALHGAATRLRGEVSAQPRSRAWIGLLAAAAVIAAVLVFGWSGGGAKPAVPVVLVAMRGGDLLAHAPAGVPLKLNPDVTGLPAAPFYVLEIVDAVGRRVWRGPFPGPPASPQRKGTYFVRISIGSGEPLREYGVMLQ